MSDRSHTVRIRVGRKKSAIYILYIYILYIYIYILYIYICRARFILVHTLTSVIHSATTGVGTVRVRLYAYSSQYILATVLLGALGRACVLQSLVCRHACVYWPSLPLANVPLTTCYLQYFLTPALRGARRWRRGAARPHCPRGHYGAA